MKNPKLYLIPTPISEKDPHLVLNAETINTISKIRFFLVENLRTARRFLKSIGYPHSIDSTWFFEISEHNQHNTLLEWIQPMIDGNDMGLLSEAGVPCVADPGYTVVNLAHQKNFDVVPLVGPSSILMALMASGLSGQNFKFHGYLPVKPDELKRKIKQIEQETIKGETQIFIETPYRNDKMFDFLISNCKSELMLCLASDINGNEEFIKPKLRIR